MKITLNELSGSLGDLGTYLPLVIGLSKLNLIDINTVLFLTGILNIVTAIAWDIPMPVQPMKSISMIAITENTLTKEQIMTSGILVGSIVLLLGLTKMIDQFNKIISKSIISGIQLGLGLNMSIKGINYIYNLNLIEQIISIILALLTFISFNYNKIPSALLLVILGSVYSIFIMESNYYIFKIPIDIDTIQNIKKNDWYYGFINGALPQLPLTLMNSVISVCALSKELFPENKKVTRISVSSSVGLMNLLTCPLGCLPMCHGAGGLAGQYKFGARNGFSILFLGLIKIILGLTCGNILNNILYSFPDGILGILLLYSGIELAQKATSKCIINNITLLTAAIQISTNTFIGTLFGIILSIIQFIIDNNDKIKNTIKNTIKNKINLRMIRI